MKVVSKLSYYSLLTTALRISVNMTDNKYSHFLVNKNYPPKKKLVKIGGKKKKKK